MKKLIISSMFAIATAFAFAGTAYQVYDVKITGTTTVGKGILTPACSDTDVAFRDTKKVIINGVIGGCGCAAAILDGSCENFVMYFWDSTNKKAITNTTLNTWILQRIGNKAQKIENIASVEFELDDTTYVLNLAGFGTYSASKVSTDDSYVSNVKGTVTGYSDAPLLVKKAECIPCSYSAEDVFDTTAIKICDCDCEESDNKDITPFTGTYVIKYNKSKAKKVMKGGVTPKALGVPAYAY